MKYRFVPEARAEFFQAALDYESREPDLGKRFRAEVAMVVDRILFDPYLWRERPGDTAESIFPHFLITLPILSGRTPSSLRPSRMGIGASIIGKGEPRRSRSKGKEGAGGANSPFFISAGASAP